MRKIPVALPIEVKVSGLTSNSLAFTTARQAGNFVEITSDIVGQVLSRTFSAGTIKVDVCPPNCPGYVTGAHVAFLKKISNNAIIGAPITFFKNNPRVAGLGGVGFNLCHTGIVLDGNATSYLPQLMAFKMINLTTGAQSSAYSFNFVTPARNTSYNPRIFRSPDGTIILYMTPANIGPAQLTAGFVDTAKSFTVIKQIAINAIYGIINAAVTSDNKINFSFAGTSYPIFSIP